MFSRPGKGTTAEYLAFKEPREVILEEDERNLPEEVRRQQAINDIAGVDQDANQAFLSQQMKAKAEAIEQMKDRALEDEKIKKREKRPPPVPDGEHGNQQAFRAVARDKFAERYLSEKMDGAPAPNKYRANHGYVHKNILRNVDFGEKGEVKN